MPFDPEYPLGSADPSQWWQAGALPRIVVHPKPPTVPAADGIDDWLVPGRASDGPDDWFVPPSAATASTGQLAPGAQTTAVNSWSPSPPAPLLDPFTAYWSLIPASRVGAMACDPAIFPGNSPNNSVTSAWPAAPSRPAGIPNIPAGGLLDGLAKLAPSTSGSGIPLGGMLDALAQLGPSSPAPASSIPTGGILDALANLGPPSPDPLFPSPVQPQSVSTQAISPISVMHGHLGAITNLQPAPTGMPAFLPARSGTSFGLQRFFRGAADRPGFIAVDASEPPWDRRYPSSSPDNEHKSSSDDERGAGRCAAERANDSRPKIANGVCHVSGRGSRSGCSRRSTGLERFLSSISPLTLKQQLRLNLYFT
jgi:hypothetical protein